MKALLFLRRLFDRKGELPERWAPRRRCKPRVRIRPDGWIVHPVGQPFPFHPMTLVETRMRGGLVLTGRDAEYAKFWHESFWTGRATSWKHNIVAYRIVAFSGELIPSQCPVWPDPRCPAGEGELT